MQLRQNTPARNRLPNCGEAETFDAEMEGKQ
jgi:hypothetical protein